MWWVGNCIRKVRKYCWELLEDEVEGGGGGQSAAVAVEIAEAWEEIMVAFCLSSAIAIATVSVQIEKMLPFMFRGLSIALVLCFGCVAFGKMTKSIFRRVSRILYYMGGILAITALFIATAIPYAGAPYFQAIIFLIYVIFCFIFCLIAHKAPPSTEPLSL